jgi:hypothetical protein
MNLKDLIAKMDAIEAKGPLAEADLTPQQQAQNVLQPGTNPTAAANPYQGADAAKFAAMSPEDQAWLTKGGGAPDINDKFILARAPNKGKPVAQASPVPPAAPTAPTTRGISSPQPTATAPAANAAGVTPQANVAGSPAQAFPVPEPGGPSPEPVPLPAPAEPVTPNSKEQIAIIQQMQKELGVAADGKIGPSTRTAIEKNPDVAAKYADQIAGAKQYPGVAANNQATSGVAAKPAAVAPSAPNTTTAEIPAEVQGIQNPKRGQEVWFKGTRYKYQNQGGSYNPDGTYSAKFGWAPTFKKGDWGWNNNQARSRQGFTSPELTGGVAAKPVRESIGIAKELVESFGYNLKD